MTQSISRISLIAVLFSISACSAMTGSSSGPLQYEAISSTEETMMLIQSSPTRFSLPIEDNEAAWERARFFLQQYAGKGKIQSDKQADKDVLTKVGTAGFRYQFTRQFDRGNVDFQVFCTPKDAKRTTAEALLNAKNVARFIREGELEISQLVGG